MRRAARNARFGGTGDAVFYEYAPWREMVYASGVASASKQAPQSGCVIRQIALEPREIE